MTKIITKFQTGEIPSVAIIFAAAGTLVIGACTVQMVNLICLCF